MPPRPDSLYGAFKVYGETILQNYFDRHGIRSVSMRIGTYRTLPIDQRSLATWLSPGDVARLVDAALRHPDPGCLVVNGYSANTRTSIRKHGQGRLTPSMPMSLSLPSTTTALRRR